MPVMTNDEQDIWLSIKMALLPREYEIYLLRYAGYTFREIGPRIGTSHMTVWRRWQKIKAKLRRKVLQTGHFVPIKGKGQ